MLTINITGLDSLNKDLKRAVNEAVKDVAQEVFIDARGNTPVRTGNARSKWNKQLTTEGFTVDNRVPYIERLEAGASKQAPKGIIGPTLTQVKGKY